MHFTIHCDVLANCVTIKGHAMSTSGLPVIKQHGQVGVQGAYMVVRDLMLLHDSGRLPVNAFLLNSLRTFGC
jgi:hypothetical protein